MPVSDTTPLRCRDVRPYLSALPDGELTEPQRAAVALHVADCPACNALLERHREVKRLLAALPASEPSPEVFERVLAARSPQAVGPVARESLRRRSRPASANRPWRAPAFVTALLTPA